MPAGLPGAAPFPVGPHQGHDPKRMHLLAKSVSITVNQGQQLESGPTMPHAPLGAGVQPTTLPTQASSAAATAAREAAEQQQEARALLHAQSWLRRACLLRCLRAWCRLCDERWWKTQLALRDHQLQSLAAQLRHLEWRPVRYLQRYRMKILLGAWVAECVRKRAKRAAWHRASAHADTSALLHALAGWRESVQDARAEAAEERRADKLHARRRKQHSLAAWRALVGRRAHKLALRQAAAQLRAARLLRNALGSWAYLARFYATERAAVKWRRRSTVQGVFAAWRGHIAVKQYHMQLVLAFRAKHAASLKGWAYLAWRGFVDGRVSFSLAQEAARLQQEAAQLREDNHRLSRVIDSGEWGRDRVHELTEAGKVLQQERDALVKLVESLPGARTRRGSRLSVVQSGAPPPQQLPSSAAEGSTGPDTMAGRRSSLAVAGSVAPSRRSSAVGASSFAPRAVPAVVSAMPLLDRSNSQPVETPSAQGSTGRSDPSAASIRNKMTVRAGSSFNALVRALKQDLLASGALARDPDAAFAVDQVRAKNLPGFIGNIIACMVLVLPLKLQGFRLSLMFRVFGAMY